jgi:hypothetical protein
MDQVSPIRRLVSIEKKNPSPFCLRKVKPTLYNVLKILLKHSKKKSGE